MQPHFGRLKPKQPKVKRESYQLNLRQNVKDIREDYGWSRKVVEEYEETMRQHKNQQRSDIIAENQTNFRPEKKLTQDLLKNRIQSATVRRQ